MEGRDRGRTTCGWNSLKGEFLATNEPTGLMFGADTQRGSLWGVSTHPSWKMCQQRHDYTMKGPLLVGEGGLRWAGNQTR